MYTPLLVDQLAWHVGHPSGLDVEQGYFTVGHIDGGGAKTPTSVQVVMINQIGCPM